MPLAGPLSADKSHLKIEKNNGFWHISNTSQGKRVEIKTSADKSRFLKRWRLQVGDQIILDDQRFNVTQINQKGYISLLHEQTNRTAIWEKGRSFCDLAFSHSNCLYRCFFQNSSPD